MPHWLLFAFGWLAFLFWISLLIPLFLMRNRFLQPLARDLPEPESWPLISVIVPALNEEENIAQSLRSLLAMDYPALEIIAVNDRSSDRTGELMEEVAATDARVKVLHIEELPAGWLGKTHAMHRGAALAQGEYLLFTDGDILFAPETFRLAMCYTLERQLDHLTLFPKLLAGGYLENVMISYFQMTILAVMHPWLVPTRVPWAYAGIGAFNLVRREVYAAVGGHEKIRLNVIDDMMLAKLLKRNGCRQDVLAGGPLVRVRWYPSLGAFVRGMEKNSFALMGYSLPRLIGATVFWFPLFLGLYLALFCLPGPVLPGYAATLLLAHATHALFGWKAGIGWQVTFGLPLAMGISIYILWRSALRTLARGGVSWRDTFYPLQQLKDNLY